MDDIARLQKLSAKPDNIRNFCTLAHVDHGKTTLSDFLLTCNGLLSSGLAGKVRFLDSRPDEQEREITMKASSVALFHNYAGKEHLLHLVDSPGHIDFSSEVSAALRLCDGALVVVDAVDGVTMQTCSMLRQALNEGVSMILVLNKIDLLVTRLQLTAEEAYHRLRGIVELCNANLAAYCVQLEIAGGHSTLLELKPGNDVWFDPVLGNVVFASSLDGWGFSLQAFAKIYGEKFGIPVEKVNSSLWGDVYFDGKGKQFVDKPKRTNHLQSAIQLIFEPLWSLHSAFLTEPFDYEKAKGMVEKIAISENVWNHPRKGSREKLAAVLCKWIPLSQCILDAVCQCLPSPVKAARYRLPILMSSFNPSAASSSHLLACSTGDDAPTIAYIAKLVDTDSLAGHLSATSDDTQEIEESLIGFARVFSGKISSGQNVWVMSKGNAVRAVVGKVFLFRGRGLEVVPEMSAGCLCGIGGLTRFVTKYATVSSEEGSPEFLPLVLPSASIVRCSVTPKAPHHLPQLVRGLKLLNQVDAQVEVFILPSGEHVIGTAGEVHTERCVQDLLETFAKVEINVSEPIVPFRETIVTPSMKPRPVTVETPGKNFVVTLYALSLPQDVLLLLKQDQSSSDFGEMSRAVQGKLKNLSGENATMGDQRRWNRFSHSIVSFGPKKLGFCGAVLIDGLATSSLPAQSPGSDEWPELLSDLPSVSSEDTATVVTRALFHEYLEAIVSGFQLACCAGSMGEEPLHGIAFIVTDIAVKEPETVSGTSFSGQIISTVKDACRLAMEKHQRRLVEPVYHCTVYSSGTTQGKIYGTLNKRRADIVEEVPNEGSDLFHINCYLPAVESFGLQDEIRIATHGAATAQLQMSHWAMIDSDPYFRPTTREELEDHGETVSSRNVADLLLEKIRRRKGLFKQVVVENAEKQKFSTKN